MLTENLIKSELSVAYLHSIASNLGFELERSIIDNDSVDITISANGKKLVPESILSSPKVGIQLKATSKWELDSNNQIRFQLSAKNYADLRMNSVVPKILVVLCLPEEKDYWLTYSAEEIVLRKCAYWQNFRGLDHDDTKSKIVYLNQIFTPETLFDILVKISKQEW